MIADDEFTDDVDRCARARAIFPATTLVFDVIFSNLSRTSTSADTRHYTTEHTRHTVDDTERREPTEQGKTREGGGTNFHEVELFI